MNTLKFPNSGMNSASQTQTIKKRIKEALHSGSSSVVVVETPDQQGWADWQPRALNDTFAFLSIELHAHGTLMSFMEEILWSLRKEGVYTDFTITDLWRMEKENIPLPEIATAFILSLSDFDQPLLLSLHHLERITDRSVEDFLSLLAQRFPASHCLVLSGLCIPRTMQEMQGVAYLTVEDQPLQSSLASTDNEEAGSSLESVLRIGNDALDKNDLQTLKNTLVDHHLSFMQSGRVWALHAWVNRLEAEWPHPEHDLAAAMGAYYTATAQYDKAKIHLDRAVATCPPGTPVHMQATVFQARLIRQTVSCDASNELVDPLIFEMEDLSTESAYFWLYEKIQNLIMNNRWAKVDELVRNLITICEIAGNARLKKWYECLMVPIHCHYGNIKEAIAYYEASLSLSQKERALIRASTVIPYAARAYFTAGQVHKGLTLLEESVRELKDNGRLHKLQSHYFALGELYFWESVRLDGPQAEEAKQKSAEALRLHGVYGRLVCPSEENVAFIREYGTLFSFLNETGTEYSREDLIASLAYAPPPFNLFLLNAFTWDAWKKEDYQLTLYYGMYAIEVGETSKQKAEFALAYALAALAAIQVNHTAQAKFLTHRFFTVCEETGSNYFFLLSGLIDPLLAFAKKEGVDPDLVSYIEAYVEKTSD